MHRTLGISTVYRPFSGYLHITRAASWACASILCCRFVACEVRSPGNAVDVGQFRVRHALGDHAPGALEVVSGVAGSGDDTAKARVTVSVHEAGERARRYRGGERLNVARHTPARANTREAGAAIVVGVLTLSLAACVFLWHGWFGVREENWR